MTFGRRQREKRTGRGANCLGESACRKPENKVSLGFAAELNSDIRATHQRRSYDLRDGMQESLCKRSSRRKLPCPKGNDDRGQEGITPWVDRFIEALVERALQAEMAEHLGHDKNEPVENTTSNTRNGKSQKTLKGEFGMLSVALPCNRHGSIECRLIPRHQNCWTGFDGKILSFYAHGMTVRVIQGHLAELYGTEVSPAPISSMQKDNTALEFFIL